MNRPQRRIVTGIGQCCWDCLAMVASYPPADSKQELLSWDEQGGGPVATALVTLARLGMECRFAGIVGNDALGGKIEASLADEGIDSSGLIRRPNAVSQQAFIVIEQGTASRTIFWQRPTGVPLLPEELPADFLNGADMLLLDGLLLDASRAAAKEARDKRVPIMLDAGRLRPGIVELAGLCDYVIAGEQLFVDLGWDGSRDTFIHQAKQLGASVVGVTRGTRGSLTWDGATLIETPAFPVVAVDTTGAGDVFHGALAFGIVTGQPLTEALQFASATAALTCRAIGGRRGIPTLAEVLAFIEHTN